MKSTKKLLTVTGFIILYFTLCSITVNAQTLKDINNKTFNALKIGTQDWSTENLKVDRFQNGDAIPQVKTDAEWEKVGKAGKPAWCYYDNDTVNGKKFGKLYNFYAITDPRGLAPKGWHVPDNNDWAILVRFLGGVDIAGIKLKSTSDWKQTINGSNKSGFTAIPGGLRFNNGSFKNINTIGQWWSTSGVIGGGVEKWSLALNSFSVEVGYFKANKEDGLSVRCIKD